ncbi:helix-turn-helix domain-containing protein [Flavobacterium sp. SM2513]|uniref:helix-turn-helix domain-containing protein n=1 Tax=Flavobacterium sp. SM2513 TaxID=3424766 RepID=UPI003D7F687D
MQNIKLRFGIRVKELSLTKGYSQELLAELANLDRTYIPGIEAGKRNVSLIVVEIIASYERMLKEKDEMMLRLEQLIQKK